MKNIALFLTTLTTLVAFSGQKGETFNCYFQDDATKTFQLTQRSDEYSQNVDSKCSKHSKIQYSWEDYSYFTFSIDGKRFSGISCEEDVNFEFIAAQRLNGKKVSLRMWLDETEDATLTIGNIEHKVSCNLL